MLFSDWASASLRRRRRDLRPMRRETRVAELVDGGVEQRQVDVEPVAVDEQHALADRVASPVMWKKRNGALFRLVKSTTSRPPWQAATGGRHHGNGYQQVSRSA